MDNPSPSANFRAFTTRAPQKSSVLRNEIEVSEAYDPHDTAIPFPPKKPFSCIWDTGATNSVITDRVITELGLKPSGRTTAHGVGSEEKETEHEVDTYFVNFLLPNKVGIYGVPVTGMKLPGTDVLIGMDIIGLGAFAVTTQNNKTTWSFCYPSMEEIDFVKKVEDYQRKKEPWTLSPEEQRKEKNRKKRVKKGKN